jgi:hypothetical protein
MAHTGEGTDNNGVVAQHILRKWRAMSALYRVAFKKQLFADAGFSVKPQIPLNPPLKKGDFKEAAVFPPLF